eukprot:gene7783-8594_t
MSSATSTSEAEDARKSFSAVSYSAISNQEVQAVLTKELSDTRKYVEELEGELKEHGLELPIKFQSSLSSLDEPVFIQPTSSKEVVVADPRVVKPVGEENKGNAEEDQEDVEALAPRQHYGLEATCVWRI